MSPGLLLLFVGQGGGTLNVGDTFLKLGGTVVIPMIAGEIVQYFFPRHVAILRQRVNFTIVSQCSLLLFVYCIFCNTFSSDLVIVRSSRGAVWGGVGGAPWLTPGCFLLRTRAARQSAGEVLALLALVASLHFTYLAICWGAMAVPWWHMNRSDRVAGLFVASQKTLGVRQAARPARTRQALRG